MAEERAKRLSECEQRKRARTGAIRESSTRFREQLARNHVQRIHEDSRTSGSQSHGRETDTI